MSGFATFYDPNAESEKEVPLPSAKPIPLGPNVTLWPPLTRRGTGPGLVIVRAEPKDIPSKWEDHLDPTPLKKWAEEGYSTVEILVDSSAEGAWDVAQGFKEGIKAILSLPETDKKDKIGLVVYEPSALSAVVSLLPSHPIICSLVAFTPEPVESIPIPALFHCHAPFEVTPELAAKFDNLFAYEDAASHFFIQPDHKDFLVDLNGLVHCRSLEFLRREVGGPYFPLEKIWDEHTYFEFVDRSVAKTMGTMVDNPYVNHVPTLTGGIGRKNLGAFYRDHFIFSNPQDIKNKVISRTIGTNTIVDEFVMSFTHDKMINWLAPGVPPTGNFVSFPMTSVVNIRGDRLFHEHIGWSADNVYKQLGLLPDWVPFPYPIKTGEFAGKKVEVRLPIVGAEAGEKMLDKDSIESNIMIGPTYGVREAK